MSGYKRTGSFRLLAALCAALALGVGARPAAAQPFAYVVNRGDKTVSVIDTATNTVVATVTVFESSGVAVTPDGKHAYVANANPSGVQVIDTATNSVVTTITVPEGAQAIAITPDGKHAYVSSDGPIVSVIDTVTNTVVATAPVTGASSQIAITPDGTRAYVTTTSGTTLPDTVSVIDTATNTLETTVTVAKDPSWVAITPDGKHAYVASTTNAVSVIDTVSNTVEITVALGPEPFGVAVTPDGARAYVTNSNVNNSPASGTVSVIDTATNTVEAATLAVGTFPSAVAVAPDGKHAYVANFGSGTVSVIDTATNTVVSTVTVGSGPEAVAIGREPFLAFKAKLAIGLSKNPAQDAFALESSFTLSSSAPPINPLSDQVTLSIGAYSATLPPGSFQKGSFGIYEFFGVINGVRLAAAIAPTGTLAFDAGAFGPNLTGIANPVPVSLAIGNASGTASVNAFIIHY
jgi:YVTN family beta-propeller protein